MNVCKGRKFRASSRRKGAKGKSLACTKERKWTFTKTELEVKMRPVGWSNGTEQNGTMPFNLGLLGTTSSTRPSGVIRCRQSHQVFCRLRAAESTAQAQIQASFVAATEIGRVDESDRRTATAIQPRDSEFHLLLHFWVAHDSVTESGEYLHQRFRVFFVELAPVALLPVSKFFTLNVPLQIPSIFFFSPAREIARDLQRHFLDIYDSVARACNFSIYMRNSINDEP